MMNTISDPEHLLKDFSETVIFKCIAGSRAYGTHRPHSDEDIRGVYVLAPSHYLSLKRPMDLVSDEKGDVVFYTLRRFLELASTANPNIIELLFMPDDVRLTGICVWRNVLTRSIDFSPVIWMYQVGSSARRFDCFRAVICH